MSFTIQQLSDQLTEQDINNNYYAEGGELGQETIGVNIVPDDEDFVLLINKIEDLKGSMTNDKEVLGFFMYLPFEVNENNVSTVNDIISAVNFMLPFAGFSFDKENGLVYLKYVHLFEVVIDDSFIKNIASIINLYSFVIDEFAIFFFEHLIEAKPVDAILKEISEI